MFESPAQKLLKKLWKLPWALIISILLALSTVGIPSYQYYCHFAQYGISDRTEVWGHLGDFLNVWVSMASLFVLSGLTYYLHSLEQQRGKDDKSMEDARSRPYVVIKHMGLNVWEARNIGNGPALNILFAISRNEEWGIQKTMTSLMSGSEGKFDANETSSGNIIGFQYCDIHDNIYSTVYQIGGVEVISKFELFTTKEQLQSKKFTTLLSAVLASRKLRPKS